MSGKIKVFIVHDTDADGYCSEALLKYLLENKGIIAEEIDSIESIPYFHSDKEGNWLFDIEENINEGELIHIYFLDCYPKLFDNEKFFGLVKQHNIKVNVIDHHVTAYKDFVNNTKEPAGKIVLLDPKFTTEQIAEYRDNELDRLHYSLYYSDAYSTVGLICRLFNHKLSGVLKLVNDWDTWQLDEDKRTLFFGMALNEELKKLAKAGDDVKVFDGFHGITVLDEKDRSNLNNPYIGIFIEHYLSKGKELISKLENEINERLAYGKELFKNGKGLYEGLDKLNKKNVAHTKFGKTLVVTDLKGSTSVAGWTLYNKYPEYDFITFIRKSDKAGYLLSFRSRNESELVLGDMCAQYGGGGHHHAAGFTTKDIKVINNFLTGK